jgi:hypothetical protein
MFISPAADQGRRRFPPPRMLRALRRRSWGPTAAQAGRSARRSRVAGRRPAERHGSAHAKHTGDEQRELGQRMHACPAPQELEAWGAALQDPSAGRGRGGTPSGSDRTLRTVKSAGGDVCSCPRLRPAVSRAQGPDVGFLPGRLPFWQGEVHPVSLGELGRCREAVFTGGVALASARNQCRLSQPGRGVARRRPSAAHRATPDG